MISIFTKIIYLKILFLELYNIDLMLSIFYQNFRVSLITIQKENS